ncbi:unnamed protein product [Lepeophtheirus salmonis]|uniref:(salmon louse) hypothetical protein n=1 Tax=Lepeophtheirus salmonis TaxID=72036 RepID=A0A7R8HE09_LEPSM|nr:unnamed protein product [Lepeophtheirus salmonis]CAF3045767.1 unnamed protein product [Lepeophtheirus salmonis]
MDSLNEDVLERIFLYLDFKTLLKAELCCRAWKKVELIASRIPPTREEKRIWTFESLEGRKREKERFQDILVALKRLDVLEVMKSEKTFYIQGTSKTFISLFHFNQKYQICFYLKVSRYKTMKCK